MKLKPKKEEGVKVWNAFTQMKTYIGKAYQVIYMVNENNFYVNENGNKVFDGVSTLVSSNIGHKNKNVIDSINKQLNTLDNVSLFTSTSDIAIQCSKILCELCGNHFYSSFFTNSGSEACDTAIKILRKYWLNKGENKVGIVSLKGAYHGSTIGSMMLAQTSYKVEEYDLEAKDFFQIQTPDNLEKPVNMTQKQWINSCVSEFKALIERSNIKIGGLFMELVQLSNGVNELPIEYVQEIADICKCNDILLIIDEVATGFGRTGSMFAYSQYGIKPDMIMVAKGITSGYIPMGGVLVTKEIFKAFWGEKAENIKLDHGFTTGGHPVACAAAISNIDEILDNNLCDNSKIMGKYLKKLLDSSIGNSSLVKQIRGKGLMLSIIFYDKRIKGMSEWGLAEIITKFLNNKGLLLYPDAETILIISPYLGITKDECNYINDKLVECIKKIEFLLCN